MTAQITALLGKELKKKEMDSSGAHGGKDRKRKLIQEESSGRCEKRQGILQDTCIHHLRRVSSRMYEMPSIQTLTN